MALDPRDMLFGYAEASLDVKPGRFAIPANLFAKMGGETRFRMTADPCERFLELRSEKAFLALAERVTAAAPGLPPETAADLITEYIAFSAEVQVDNALRLVVPKGMREVLGDDTELALVAVGDALRVWSLAKYREARKSRRTRLAEDYPKFVNVILGFPAPAAQRPEAGPAAE